MKKIILSIFLINIALSSMVFAQENKKEMKEMKDDGKKVSIAIVVDSVKKSKNAKKLFFFIPKGLKKAGVKKETMIEFIETASMTEAMVAKYDVVIALNEGSEKSLSAMQLAFVEANKDKLNVFAVALLPKKSKLKTLKTLPKGIDVLASPSTKAGATNLVVERLSKKIAAML